MTTDPTYACVTTTGFYKGTRISVHAPNYSDNVYFRASSGGVEANFSIALDDALALRDALDRVVGNRATALAAVNQLTLPEAA